MTEKRMTLDSLKAAAGEARRDSYAVPSTPAPLQETADGYGPCPGCSKVHEETSRERRPNGNTTCGACGEKTPSSRWKG